MNRFTDWIVVAGDVTASARASSPTIDLAAGGERHHRRHDLPPRADVGDDPRRVVLEDGHEAVRRAEIDAYDAFHCGSNSLSTSRARVRT